jgi:hypothetical protein
VVAGLHRNSEEPRQVCTYRQVFNQALAKKSSRSELFFRANRGGLPMIE